MTIKLILPTMAPIPFIWGRLGDWILSTFSTFVYTPETENDIFFDNMESGSENKNWTDEGDWVITDKKSSPSNFNLAWSDSPFGNYQNGII